MYLNRASPMPALLSLRLRMCAFRSNTPSNGSRAPSPSLRVGCNTYHLGKYHKVVRKLV